MPIHYESLLNFPIPEVRAPRDYPAFAEAMRAIMRAKGHAHLARTDMFVADAAAALDG